MFGFALALSIPFTLFAIFPSWLKTLPKSGSWLNTVKVVLGFIVLAVSLKFLSVADLSSGWGLLDSDIFISLWIVLFVLLGIYLLGKIKLKGDSDLKHVPLPRLFLAMISLAFAIYMVPGLWGAPLKPLSSIIPPLSTQDFKLVDNSMELVFDDYEDRKSTRLNSSHVRISYAVFCLKKKNKTGRAKSRFAARPLSRPGTHSAVVACTLRSLCSELVIPVARRAHRRSALGVPLPLIRL